MCWCKYFLTVICVVTLHKKTYIRSGSMLITSCTAYILHESQNWWVYIAISYIPSGPPNKVIATMFVFVLG